MEQNGEKEDGFEDEISRALLSALVGQVEFIKEQDVIKGIAFAG